MSKSLTVEQLKSLPAEEWVWIKLPGNGCFYAQKSNSSDSNNFVALHHGVASLLEYENYHTDKLFGWTAWKNKEQAEAKGRIVELSNPVIRPWDSTGERGFSISFPRIVEDVEHYDTEIDAERRRAELMEE